MYHLVQTRTLLLPVTLTLLQLITCSGRSVSPKHPLRMPGLLSPGKHDVVKGIVTSRVKVNITSPILINQASRNSTYFTSSEEAKGTSVTSQERSTSREEGSTSEVTSHQTGVRNTTLEDSDTRNLTSSSGRVGNVTSHLTSGNDEVENKNQRVDPSPAAVVVDGCFRHRCSNTSRCDASEGLIPDTGLPYVCRCHKDYYGIFCTIPKASACADCTGPGLYCHRTGMHWSGHFCYDMTQGWARVGTGSCGSSDMTCDGGLRCVPPSALCDGIPDCQDGADEKANCRTVGDRV